MAPGCFHLSTIKPATRPKVSYCHFHRCTWSSFGTDTEHLDHCTILHAQRFGTVGMLGVGLLKQEPPQNGRIQFGRPFETIQEGLPNLETPLQMSRANIVAVSKEETPIITRIAAAVHANLRSSMWNRPIKSRHPFLLNSFAFGCVSCHIASGCHYIVGSQGVLPLVSCKGFPWLSTIACLALELVRCKRGHFGGLWELVQHQSLQGGAQDLPLGAVVFTRESGQAGNRR